MKRAARNRFWIAVLTAAWLALSSCYRGHGLSPLAPDSNGTTGIRGKIVFSGAWPDSTREVRVAVLKDYPVAMHDPDSLLAFVLVNLTAFSDTLPRFSRECDYQINLPTGTYAWVLVAWFPDIPMYLFGVKELGAFYRMTGTQKTPSAVHVIPGVMMEGINISADLGNVKRQIPFFKASRSRMKK
jgi:hypothetical protein